MPITKQAEKKLRRDKKTSTKNASVRLKLRKLIKITRKSPTPKTLSAVFAALDKAAKRNIIHKNKAGRLKSRLARLLAKT
ncbi:30S ribosomal protein S20 [Candidatus Gottesmanbacteria bacterium]|nr:30S ribosomal protein S20 [Candidatus Gottesmanbacteria bacterium]